MPDFVTCNVILDTSLGTGYWCSGGAGNCVIHGSAYWILLSRCQYKKRRCRLQNPPFNVLLWFLFTSLSVYMVCIFSLGCVSVSICKFLHSALYHVLNSWLEDTVSMWIEIKIVVLEIYLSGE